VSVAPILIISARIVLSPFAVENYKAEHKNIKNVETKTTERGGFPPFSIGVA